MRTGAPIQIGVSGKRNIAEGEQEKVRREIKQRIAGMLRQHGAHSFTGYTSLATGADTLFAEVVLGEFNMPLHVILPFPAGEYERDFEGMALEKFRSLLKQATSTEVTGGMPTDNDTRNAGYYAAGKMIADRCDGMVIVWDGLPPRGVGGTAEILGYVYEKRGSRACSIIKVKPARPDPMNDQLLHTYIKANRLAILARNRYKRVWKAAILLGWLTAGIFAFKIAFHLGGIFARGLTMLEFLFAGTVFLLTFLARRRNYHGNYLRERMKAETCRLLRAFYHAGVPVGVSEQSGEVDGSLSQLGQRINQELAGQSDRTTWYTQYVIRSLIDEQCAYHENKIKDIGDNHHLCERINLFVGVLFMINLAVHLANELITLEGAEQMLLYQVTVFFNIFFPASYAAMEGVVYFNEWALLKKYSAAAAAGLRQAGSMLPAVLEDGSAAEARRLQAQALHMISGIMLTDNKNWNLLLADKNNYHLIV